MGVFFRLLGWFGGFAAAAIVLAAWLVPPRLDWSVYRDEVQRIASAQLGREFRIAGPFALALLPAPRLAARGVAIGEPGDSFTGTAEELRLTLALGRLLLGDVVVTEMTLVAPRLQLRDLPAPIWVAAVRPAPFLASARVSLERGEVTVGGATFSSVSARLSAQGPLGPYAVAGDFEIGGLPVDVQMTLGRAGFDGAATLEATFAARGSRAFASGVVLHGGFVFSGRIDAEGPDLSALLPAPAQPFRAQARLSVEGGAGSADQLSLEIGPARMTGAVSFATQPTPRVDIALAAVRLGLDPWLEPSRRALRAPPFPIGLDLSVEAAEIGGGTLRALRASLLIAEQQVAVNEAVAVLPGGAEIALAGAIANAERGPRFEGLVELDAPDLRAMLAWLGATPDWAGPEALRSFALSARVAAEPGLLQVEQGNGRLDGVTIEGGVVLRPPGDGPDGRIQLGAGLRIAALDLDTLLPDGLADLRALGLDRFDANLRLEVDSVGVRGITAGQVGLDATVEGGRLSLRRLTAGDLAGGRMTLSGSAELGQAARISSFDFDFAGADASRLGPLLPTSQILAAASPVWQGGYVLRAEGRAAGEALEITAVAELLDARLEAAGTADAGFTRAAGRIALRHPGAPRLLSALGLADTTSWLGDGSLAIVANGLVTAGELRVESAEVVAGSLRASLAGEVSRQGRFRLAVDAENLPLPAITWGDAAPWPAALLDGWTGSLTLEADEMPLGDTAGFSRVEARLEVADAALRLPLLRASLRGGTLTGSASLTRQGRFAADAVLADTVIDQPLFGTAFDISGGVIGFTASITGTGLSPAALLASVSGQAQVMASSGIVTGFDLPMAAEAMTASLPEAEALARVRQALSGGATGFEQLQMDLRAERGIVSIIESSLGAAAGTAAASGEIDLRAGALGISISVVPLGAEQLPELGLRASGSLDQPRRVIETAAAARHLAERARAPRQ